MAEGLAGAPMLEWLGITGNLRSGGIDADGVAGGAGKTALGEEVRIDTARLVSVGPG